MKVIENTAESRFEAKVEGQTLLIDYIIRNNVIYLTHTEVPSSLGGKGLGSELVKQSLGLIKEKGLQLVPSCSFVKSYIDKNPEWKSLLV